MAMKKILILLLALVLSFPLNAQSEKHEISASYGLITTDQIVDIFEDIFVTIFSLGYFEKGDYNYTGALFLTYNYIGMQRLSLGITAGLDRVQGSLLVNDLEEGLFNESHYTLAAEMDFIWINRNFIEVYSGLGLGYTFTENHADMYDGAYESVTSSHPTFQLDVLGIRLGRKLGVYSELGFGYKGILNFGASYKF